MTVDTLNEELNLVYLDKLQLEKKYSLRMPEIRGVSLNPVRAEIGIYTTATLGAGLIRLELAQNQIRVLDTLKKSDGSGNLVAWN